MPIIEVNDRNFAVEVRKHEVVIVDFWAPWCAPCRMIAPVLEALSQENGLTVLKLNVDRNPYVAGQYRIMSIPTMMVFKNGLPAETLVGYMPKDVLKRRLQPYFIA
ncbi:thioredoxin [Thermicanus aegyptius]|uniref:thioredoxin n=1 Tax=Thermicanus aegyptius TaxID=94009 RepID=UPI00048FE5DB|nr:thioredoxin [Thermicanus aegyptius]